MERDDDDEGMTLADVLQLMMRDIQEVVGTPRRAIVVDLDALEKEAPDLYKGFMELIKKHGENCRCGRDHSKDIEMLEEPPPVIVVSTSNAKH